MSDRADLLVAMRSTIHRYLMMDRGDKILVAVSGGPDSVALLHALLSLQSDLEISLHVAHLNHSMRGEASDEDAAYVGRLAAELKLEFTSERIDVPEIRKALRLSEEEAARVVRYDFLERTAEAVKANRIAVGHNADDQVETVLFNFLRGTGVDGLSGMPPVRGKIVRPLIEIRRAEIEKYLEEHGLSPRIDLTNLQAKYTRNRIRLELLPEIRQYNSEVDSAILRLSELAREDSAYLNRQAEEAFDRLVKKRDDNSLSLDVSGLQLLALALRRRLIRLAARTVRGEIADIGLGHVDELLRLLDAGRDFRYELPGGVFVVRERADLSFSSCPEVEVAITYSRELPIPGKAVISEIEARIESEISHGMTDSIRPRGSAEVVLDRERIVGTVRVRNWLPGDRVQPLGMSGHKKVQDIFVDAKIPRAVRHRIPLVVDDQSILWIPCLAISEKAKTTPTTREFLILRVGN